MSSAPAVLPDLDTEQESRTRRQPPYNVVLINDDDHSYEYVIIMLKELFAHPVEKGYELARIVDETGRAIVCTTSLERAELKQEQIHAYGPDPRIPRCQGSMYAEIEPAE
ncbi:MAG TPA: ATP-dependent Clp protease adaptor ClpS [Gemmataceae bacterium]|jgi:ATP-dependent Clp protease adaptor protein ClpS